MIQSFARAIARAMRRYDMMNMEILAEMCEERELFESARKLRIVLGDGQKWLPAFIELYKVRESVRRDRPMGDMMMRYVCWTGENKWKFQKSSQYGKNPNPRIRSYDIRSAYSVEMTTQVETRHPGTAHTTGRPCSVTGCVNRSGQDVFIGNMCSPCYLGNQPARESAPTDETEEEKLARLPLGWEGMEL